jgi:hypothetical protein
VEDLVEAGAEEEEEEHSVTGRALDACHGAKHEVAIHEVAIHEVAIHEVAIHEMVGEDNTRPFVDKRHHGNMV